MKVIREKTNKGPLKDVVFLGNGVSIDEELRITDLAYKISRNTAKTKKLTKDDIINLNNYIEITTSENNYCLIEICDNLTFYIRNLLNKDETEWVMQYTFYKDNNLIFHKFDLEESLNYKNDGQKIIDILTKNDILNIGFSQK